MGQLTNLKKTGAVSPDLFLFLRSHIYLLQSKGSFYSENPSEKKKTMKGQKTWSLQIAPPPQVLLSKQHNIPDEERVVVVLGVTPLTVFMQY